jgi:hypothetical protein
MAERDFCSYEAILESMRRADINSEDARDEGLAVISAAGGESFDSRTPSEDLLDALPIGDALNFSEFAASMEFQKILALGNAMMDGWVRASKNEKLTQDARTLNHNKAIGIEKFLVAIGEAVLESQERVDNATTAERRAIVRHKRPVAAPEPEVSVSEIIDESIAPSPDEDDLVPVRIDGVDYLKRGD